LVWPAAACALPATFNLRNVNGSNFVTSVKNQSGGTCWCHGTLAAVEGNLLIGDEWESTGVPVEPNLAEYHLDWWNGFNQHNNDDRDPPAGGGLVVHQGGDYLVASAYMTRGEGAVYCAAANDAGEGDTPWYSSAPARFASAYTNFYPRHVEWFEVGAGLSNIDAIKQALVDHGVLATCMYWGGGFYSSASDSHYQPPTDGNDPNHSIAIVGWDDNRWAQAPANGAWLCKNSWGSAWSGDGYFWISYYDKHCCRHEEMGAVSFRDMVVSPYTNTYYHDYHGWRDTMATSTAFNAFTAETNEMLAAVGMFTTDTNVGYTVRVYGEFSGGSLSNLLATRTGAFTNRGYHTVDLAAPLYVAAGESFCVFLEVSGGGQAIDCTSSVDVLLDARAPDTGPSPFEIHGMGKTDLSSAGTEVVSAAGPGESYYWDGGAWVDLTNYNSTANFCIKGLTRTPGTCDTDGDGLSDYDELMVYHCSPTNANTDGDAMTDREEVVADTNPTNPASFFCVTAISNLPPMRVYFQSSSNRVYTLTWRSNLLDETWLPLSPSNVTGSGGADHLDDTNTPAGGSYRLKVREEPSGD